MTKEIAELIKKFEQLTNTTCVVLGELIAEEFSFEEPNSADCPKFGFEYNWQLSQYQFVSYYEEQTLDIPVLSATIEFLEVLNGKK